MEVFGIVCMADLQEQWQDVHPAGHMSGAAPHAHRRERPLAPAWEVCRQAAPHAEKVSYCLLWSLLFFVWVFEHAVLGKFKLLKSSWSSVACFVDSEEWNLRIIHLVYILPSIQTLSFFYLPFFCHFLYTCSVLFSSIFFILTLPHPHCKVRKKEKRGGGYIGMTLGTWASQHFLVVFSGVNL